MRYRALLRSYFTSGWAFFIPYLAVYLLYAGLGAPVNRTDATVEEQGARLLPPLLHVYLALHSIHAALALLALVLPKDPTQLAEPKTFDRIWPVVPWILLGLLFWVPGVYLEWPSDPWEHLRRINEWHAHDAVVEHSTWKKSSYFLAYSLTRHVTGLTQLTWLNFYYVAVCLLLSWQYYRLARVVGLSDRASFVFVLLNALTFGNSIFSFYRYYGLSTSIYAQISVLALTRTTLIYLGRGQPTTERKSSSRPDVVMLQTESSTAASRPRMCWNRCRASVEIGAPRVATFFLLLGLGLFNHPQSTGIVALAVGSIVFWRLCTHARSKAAIVTFAAILLSLGAITLAVRSPTLTSLQHSGWLSSWCGFNVLSFSSPAFDSSARILGWIGGINLLAGLWLLRNRHIVGFLTVGPVLILALPHSAIPIAMLLDSYAAHENGVFLFHRLLFAIPASLAIAVLGERLTTSLYRKRKSLPHRIVNLGTVASLSLVLLFLSSGGTSAFRFWHSIYTVPADLALQSHVEDIASRALASATSQDRLVLSNKIGADLVELFSPARRYLLRIHVAPISEPLENSLAAIEAPDGPAKASVPQDCGFGDVAFFTNRSARIPPEVLVNPEQVADWTYWIDSAPEFKSTPEGLIVTNPSGYASAPFSSSLIPIEHFARYRVSAQVKGIGPPSAQNYLGVAWYDSNKTLLLSRQLNPQKTEYPLGWTNGDFSYFGLAASAPPNEWTTYSIDFGPGEAADIPHEAAFFRIGALLNQDLKAEATTQIRSLMAVKKAPYERFLLAAPYATRLFSVGSTAGRLSRHWLPQHVATDHAGALELGIAFSRYVNSLPTTP